MVTTTATFLEQLHGNMLVLGESPSGTAALLRNLILEAAEREIPCSVIDTTGKHVALVKQLGGLVRQPRINPIRVWAVGPGFKFDDIAHFLCAIGNFENGLSATSAFLSLSAYYQTEYEQVSQQARREGCWLGNGGLREFVNFCEHGDAGIRGQDLVDWFDDLGEEAREIFDASDAEPEVKESTPILYDLSDISSDLRSVEGMFLPRRLVDRMMGRGTGHPGSSSLVHLVIIEEIAEFLSCDTSRPWLRSIWTDSPKYGIKLVGISQDIHYEAGAFPPSRQQLDTIKTLVDRSGCVAVQQMHQPLPRLLQEHLLLNDHQVAQVTELTEGQTLLITRSEAPCPVTRDITLLDIEHVARV